MKKISFIIGSLVLVAISSCKNKGTETTTVSAPQIQVGVPVSPGAVSGSVKGTMTSGNTYTVTADITIPVGDTLLLQSGVTVYVADNVNIIVKGTMISLGTESAPNRITSADAGAQKINSVTEGDNPTADPAYKGWWTGINCDTSCKLLDLKWTHVDFGGADFAQTGFFVGDNQGSKSHPVLFQSEAGYLIVEDSWFYGCVDDAIHLTCGNFHIMRNTFEKCGAADGDVCNAKNGSVGDMAYNLIVGGATNGTRASNSGTNSPTETNINMYNNTYINCGYRQSGQSGRRGSMDYEVGARGLAYNCLLVNCRTGLGIESGSTSADTINCHYGYLWNYCDSVLQLDQIFPIDCWTRPSASLSPTYLQLGYVYPSPDSLADGAGSAAYNASTSLQGINNPVFVNFALPEITNNPGMKRLQDIAYVTPTGGTPYDFRLQSGSPCIGVGYTGFSPLNATAAITNTNFKATVTAPSADLGCFPTSGNGNQHFPPNQ